jgi:ElaB/YqjD/DUF883 family membrane-anchored ribosome-binding protein
MTKEIFMTTAKHTANSDDAAAGNIGSPISDADLQSLRDDIAHLTQQIAGLLVATGEETLDGMKGQIRRAKQNIDDLMTDAKANGRDAVDAVREATDPVVKGVEDAVYKHPIMALAVAVGLGLAFGVALRR